MERWGIAQIPELLKGFLALNLASFFVYERLPTGSILIQIWWAKIYAWTGGILME